MFLSVFEMFKIGVGPSSSHTMGPMTAANRFLAELKDGDWPRPSHVEVAALKVSLHGSLAFTGVGHGTGRAVILGLCGEAPDTVEATNIKKGEMMFRGQCGACHSENGYRAMSNLLKDRDEKSISNILQMLHENKDDSPYRRYMPPLVGKDDEIKALAAYLKQLSVKSVK